MSSVGVFSLGASEGSSEKIVINVGGVKHETHKSTLMTLPGSRLAQLMDAEKPPSELFFDRHPAVFTHVLQYYRSGKLHCPTNLCGVLLEEEFDFWGISGTDVEPCCWAAFRQNKDAVEALAQIDPSVMENDQSSQTRAWQPKIWALFDNPLSSLRAKVIAVVSLFFILLSIAAFSLQTYPGHQIYVEPGSNSSKNFIENPSVLPRVLDGVELVCSIWFVFEFVTRAVSCPSKLRFFMNVMNVVDLLALFPWLFRWCSGKYCMQALGFLHVMRCIRVLRVFSLMQHVFGVRVLKHTLHASATALCAVPLMLFSCTLIFSTMAYYAEFDRSNIDSSFTDFPSSYWWAVVTLTTVGYGDIFPITVAGRCVAILCAMVGVLLIILPVPIIVNNFIKFNSLLKTKYSMPRKKEKISVHTAPSSST